MDFVKLLEWLFNQMETVLNAPIPFLAFLLLGWWGIWKLTKGHYKGQISEYDARIGVQSERIGLLKDKLEDTQAKSAELEPAIKAIPAIDEVAKEHSATASMIASDVSEGLEQAHLLATTGIFEPVLGGSGGLKYMKLRNPKKDDDES